MNKIIGAIGITMLIVFALGIATAETSVDINGNEIITNADGTSVVVNNNLNGSVSVNADSSFYGLKLGWEKLGLWFTFNQEKKAEKELELANKRLIEARIMAENGNVKGFERAQEEHDKLIERAQERIYKLGEESQSEKVKESVKKISGLQIALENQKNKIAILSNVLANGNLSNDKRAKIESAISRMENKTSVFELKIEERKTKMETKLQKISNMTEEEARALVNEIENRTGLHKVKEIMIERKNERIDNLKNKIGDLKDRIRERNPDTHIENETLDDSEDSDSTPANQ